MPPFLSSQLIHLPLPLEPDHENGWKSYRQFHGPAVNMDELSCHVSVLVQNHSPHPPHPHPEEEILLMLTGEADLILPSLKTSGQGELRLRPGQFVYYPAHFPHTLRAASEEPANYLMFKWGAHPRKSKHELPFGHFDGLPAREEGTPAHELRPVFEGPTRCLQKLHSHATTMPAGAFHPSHSHRYETALILFEGELEIFEQHLTAPGLVFFGSNDPHMIRNAGAGPARYLVFEFHGEPDVSLLEKLIDPARWKRRWKRVLTR